MTYTLTIGRQGYDAGAQLRDVTLQEARSWECNRCGDCCDGMAPNVRKDEATGLPLQVWGTKFPGDLYEARYGRRALVPIVLGDGGPELGDSFELDADGKPYTAFQCALLNRFHDGAGEGPETACSLYGLDKDPNDVSTIRPLNCGDFPVFGLAVDDSIVLGQPFIVPTGALPRCTWHGIRIVGPWKPTPYWEDRWEKQQRGEPVPDLSWPQEFIDGLVWRQEQKRKGGI